MIGATLFRLGLPPPDCMAPFEFFAADPMCPQVATTSLRGYSRAPSPSWPERDRSTTDLHRRTTGRLRLKTSRTYNDRADGSRVQVRGERPMFGTSHSRSHRQEPGEGALLKARGK